MSDDFEDLLKRWLRDHGATDRSAIEAVAGHVAVLPPRRRRQLGPLAVAAAVIVAIGLAAFALVPRQSSVTSQPSSPVPPDPAAFAGDARLARCGASVDTALDVFEMGRARDYRLHLPAMGLSPELDVDTPGFVVVFRDMQPFAVLGAPPPAGQTWPPRSLAPGHHDVCILVGADPATAELNIYDDVDITGLAAFVAGTDPSTSSGPDATASVAASPSIEPSLTPEPAPAWVDRLAGQLECTGEVANIGDEVSGTAGTDPLGPTAAAALTSFLGPTNAYASLPAGGFTQIHVDIHWASFGHLVGGRLKAVIVLTDISDFGPGWVVRGIRACDASEFDPAVPLTFPVTIWTDSSGARVSTDLIRSMAGPAHCGWDTVTFLQFGGDLYFRDPKGAMNAWTTTSFEPRALIPRNAEASGYRSGGAALWTVPGGDAYLDFSGHVERWPRSTDSTIGCM
ncbi:MAG TPA: hypothetical protein VHM48_12510 [Candidatus Limnocylindrales bacterium]|nr:hypothetical protein [Candidatus Limnocylindrales bacterium]